MEYKIFYSKSQFDATVDFIANNNPHYSREYSKIEECLLGSIRELAQGVIDGKDIWSIGTMGYMVSVDSYEEESIYNDENSIYLEILVDPALGNRDFSEEDEAEFTLYSKSKPTVHSNEDSNSV